MATRADAAPAAPRDERATTTSCFVTHSSQLALAVFLAYLAVAFALLVGRFGSGTWFMGDDWGMLDGRDLWSIDGLLRPQNGHWSTFPVVIYQVLYRIVGLRTYTPYLAVTVVLHLTLCVLLRLVMRRAGVGPWMATFVASTFVLFGTGYENIVTAIQISMTGSLVFGVAQLLLADHDGPVGRRDLAGLACGLVAIMASSVGLAVVVAVGLAVLIRRGWRAALLNTAPLAATYLAWFAWQRASGVAPGSIGSGGPAVLAAWVLASIAGVFTAVGEHALVAVALGVLLVGGCALAWVPLDRRTFRAQAAAPLGLALSAIALAALIGSQRGGAVTMETVFDGARVGRYVAMMTALTLPALGVAAAAVQRRWRFATPVVVVLLLLGVPGNIAEFDGDGPAFRVAVTELQTSFVVGVAESPVAREVSPDVHVNPHELLTANLTVGFVLQAARDGRLPDAAPVSEQDAQRIATRLSLSQSLASVDEVPPSCGPHTAPITVRADRGQELRIQSPVSISLHLPSGQLGAPTPYTPAWAGTTLTSQFDGLTFDVGPAPGSPTFAWCT